MPAAIATYGLTKEFPAGGGVRSISFQVHPGEVVGIVGPPGAGKSTLLNLLATRLPACRGSFTMHGCQIPAGRLPAAAVQRIRSRTGALLEDCPVMGDLTGWENAWLFARLQGVAPTEARRRLEVLFEWAGMAAVARRPARTYSYPLRKKLGIITAMVHGPGVLLLDEPCHGLEPGSRLALQLLLTEARQKGTTAVVTTTDLQEARLLCTRLLLLDAGRVVAEGPAPDLTRSPWTWSSIEVRLDRPGLDLDLTAVPGVRFSPEYEGCGLRVRVDDPESALSPLIAAVAHSGGRIRSVEVRRP